MAILEIKDLHVTRDGKEILKGVNLKTGPGEVHAIMGPNGSGKSTLAYTLLAHPKYEVTSGDILLDNESILDLTADEAMKIIVAGGLGASETLNSKKIIDDKE